MMTSNLPSAEPPLRTPSQPTHLQLRQVLLVVVCVVVFAGTLALAYAIPLLP